MRFLNPKTDYAFKKIFGSESSKDILISFLNAILDLTGEAVIVDVTVVDPRLAPKIEGMKDTYLDVRVRDQCGRSYIVEMQVLNVEGFEKRVLYNACKAYVNQRGKGDPYPILTEVVAVTLTDFVMLSVLERVVSRFRLRADENPVICSKDLELVFAELPKFIKGEADLANTLERWFYFLKTAKDLTAIPEFLAVEPAIVHAFELANEGAWSREELDELEKREMWIGEQRHILELSKTAEQRGLAKGLVEGEARGKAEGKAEGEAKGKADTLLRQLRRRFKTLPSLVEDRVLAAGSDQLDEWSDLILDARELADVFGADQKH
ncbi:transposase [uncultured Gammaproteobacteria bacterium]